MDRLENKIAYSFKDKALLRLALTHSSYSNERGEGRRCNERLEFLGDSLLGFFVAESLYKNAPEDAEGDMTRRRAQLVCEASLFELAGRLELGSHILLGKGEELGGGRKRASILADAVEAIIAAVYLDGGIEDARGLVTRLLLDGGSSPATGKRDHKTMLQELIQSRGLETPVYEDAGDSGPDHDKLFSSKVLVGGEVYGSGSGRSKKEAEQSAAEDALARLDK